MELFLEKAMVGRWEQYTKQKIVVEKVQGDNRWGGEGRREEG